MQDDWGVTVFGRLEMQRARERMKKRRQRAVQSLRKVTPAPEPVQLNRHYEVFVTSSGIQAVRPRFWRSERCGPISMPYVPFLHGEVSR